MRVGFQRVGAALILGFLTLSAEASSAGRIAFAIERNLGRDGDLGKETLLLECPPAAQKKSCEIRKTVRGGATLSGKMPYADASRILNELFKSETDLSSGSRSKSSAHVRPIIFWEAQLSGKVMKGSFEAAMKPLDLAVLSTERKITRGFKP